MVNVVLALAALLLGFAKTGVAGTLGPFVTVLLTLVMPADEAIGVLLPMLIVADAFSVAAYWKAWETRVVALLVLASLIGIALGSLVISSISEHWLQRLIAISLLVFAYFHLRGRGVELPHHLRQRWALPAGASAGFTSTVAHAGGPPIVVYLMTLRLEPRRFVGTSVAFFALVNLLKVPGYYLAGLFDTGLIRSTMWAWLLLPLGVALGRALVDRIDRVRFERITLALLITGSVVLLVT